MGSQTSAGCGKHASFEQNASTLLARWRWRLLHYFKQVVNLSATCFHVELEQFSACFCVARVCHSVSWAFLLKLRGQVGYDGDGMNRADCKKLLSTDKTRSQAFAIG